MTGQSSDKLQKNALKNRSLTFTANTKKNHSTALTAEDIFCRSSPSFVLFAKITLPSLFREGIRMCSVDR